LGIVPAAHLSNTRDNLEAEITTQGETMEWTGSTERTANAMPPICEKCGSSLAFVGRLPAIRLLPLLQVYKCSPCNHVVAMRP
jgi:hypothetical protein